MALGSNWRRGLLGRRGTHHRRGGNGPLAKLAALHSIRARVAEALLGGFAILAFLTQSGFLGGCFL